MDKRQLWEQLPGENATWYSRFREWLGQKKPRSFLKICNKDRELKGRKRTDTPSTSWRLAFKKYCWTERAAAWDAAEIKRLAIELAEEQEEQRRWERAKAARMGMKADDLMDLPVTQVEDKEVEGIVIMKAAPSITFKHAGDLYLGSSTLARRALGMSEKVEEQRHTDSKGKDLQAMRGVFIFPPIPPEETDPIKEENEGKARRS